MYEPFVRIGVVGIASHALERYLERNGYPGMVGYVKVGTYVVYGLITLAAWNNFFGVLASMFGFYLPW